MFLAIVLEVRKVENDLPVGLDRCGWDSAALIAMELLWSIVLG